MEWLGNLPIPAQALIVVVVFATLTVGGLYLVRWRIPPAVLRDDHDVAGFTFGVVGAFYGVILAFVIVAVWQRFERANEAAQHEALALSNLYDLAGGFDEPARLAMQNALRDYTSNVVNREWAAMATYDRQSMSSEERIWRVLSNYTPSGPRQQTFSTRASIKLRSSAMRASFATFTTAKTCRR